jgi:hypothetical protein
MNPKKMRQIMGRLAMQVGKEVVVNSVLHGKPSFFPRAVLQKVVPYEYVVLSINGKRYSVPFVGTCVAIQSIHGVKQDPIYENSLIDSNYNLSAPRDVAEVIKTTFGKERAARFLEGRAV